MSIAYKCDRCGDLFNYSNVKYIYRGHIKVEKNKPSIVMFRNNDKREDIDFCPKCAESFANWFISGGK